MFDNRPIRRFCFFISLFFSVLLMVAPALSNKSDLQIKFLDSGPTDPNPPLIDRQTSFYAQVVNTGTQTIKGPFTVMFELDGKLVKTWRFPSKKESKDYDPGTQNIIPPGKSRLYQYIAKLAPGKHSLHWVVNAAGESELKATVEAQIPPDLTINIWPSGDNVLAYKETEWNVELKNIGGGKAYGPFVILFNSVPTSDVVAPLVFPEGTYLDRDETYLFQVSQLYNSLDTVTVTAAVDYHGDVTEALPFGEENNNFEKKYTPRYIDLAIYALEIKPAQPTAGGQLEITFTIRNKGNMDAARPFNIAILLKEASSGVLSVIDSLDASPLPADASVQLTKKINLSSAGNYTAQIIVDANVLGPNPNIIGKQYDEPDETNNIIEGMFTVSASSTVIPTAARSSESPCRPGKANVKLLRIVSDCSTEATQPYTGFIPPIKDCTLKRITNNTSDWKIKIVDSFNFKGIGGGEQCRKYGGHCWNLMPVAILGPTNSWTNNAINSLNSGKSINVCLEPLSNAPFPLEVQVEYEYECIQQP